MSTPSPELSAKKADHPKIVVAAHKPYPMPDDPLYLPVQAGAKGKDSIGFARDDQGDSISSANPYLSELTALYWAWKNLDESCDAFGLAHYRRHFKGDAPIPSLKCKVLSQKQAVELLHDCPVILPKKRRYYIETLESHYAHTLDPADLDLLAQVIRYQYPEYEPALYAHLKKRSGHMFNMFLMERSLADAYCTFLFGVLEEVMRRAHLEEKDAFAARMPGRISEFLLDVWIDTNEICCIEIPLTSTEPVNWFKKGSAFLKAKFFSKKYSSSF